MKKLLFTGLLSLSVLVYFGCGNASNKKAQATATASTECAQKCAGHDHDHEGHDHANTNEACAKKCGSEKEASCEHKCEGHSHEGHSHDHDGHKHAKAECEGHDHDTHTHKHAEDTHTHEASFKVSGNCEMCKTRIENAAKAISGVEKAAWNEESKLLSLTYVHGLDLHKVHHAINDAGHDSEGHTASDEAYKALPACCQYR